MKRLCYLVALMAISSSAYASESYSFVVGGHRINIAASRYCSSPSCVSVSIPGIYQTRRKRDRYIDADATPSKPAKPAAPAPAPQQISAPPAAAPASKPVASVALPPPPAPAIVVPPAPPAPPVVKPVVAEAPPAAPPPAPPSNTPPVVTSAITPPTETAKDAVPPAPDSAPKVMKASNETPKESAETPLGDWQTEGKKGTVRIEQCGHALCGYLINASSKASGETVLINMKPKTASQWTGNIYSRDSGETYYATMALKGPNALRVEACAFGRFFCSGNDWLRIEATPQDLISDGQSSPPPPRS
jgi:uncharacterized protein (DUF2147 family)